MHHSSEDTKHYRNQIESHEYNQRDTSSYNREIEHSKQFQIGTISSSTDKPNKS